MPDYDSPWKEMLDGYFPAFMAFFFPEAHADIDWTRGYESLDTDLPQIVRDAALGTRLADKLMQVWRRDGVEQIVLVHTEIQGSREADFARGQRQSLCHGRHGASPGPGDASRP